MKHFFLSCMACMLVSISFVSAGDFGFGINADGSEDETITATHEVAVGGTPKDQEEGLVDNVVKSIVNWFLGILWLIALIMMLYGGFLMVTAAGEEESYNKWWKILKSAAVGLIIIGIARFVLSLIFWLIVTAGDGVWGAGSDT